jgi:hypothetical protein
MRQGRRTTAGLDFLGRSKAVQFITHSSNKIDGTGDRVEHRTPAAVVGAGNANT